MNSVSDSSLVMSPPKRDIESRDPDTGYLRFIEVKGRIQGADTVTISRNEIMASFNKPEQFILALVQVPRTSDSPATAPWAISEEEVPYTGGMGRCDVRYVRHPFDREPGFGEVSTNFSLTDLWNKGVAPMHENIYKKK